MRLDAVLAAHVSEDGRRVQSVEDHNRGTARRCSIYLADIGLGKTGYLIGYLHDIGKLKRLFDMYVRRLTRFRRGDVNHTFFAVQYVLKHYHRVGPVSDCISERRRTVAELVAVACGVHHGLFDCYGPDGKRGLVRRLEHPDIQYEEVFANLGEDVRKEIDELFDAAADEIFAKLDVIVAMADAREDVDDEFWNGEVAFYCGQLVRVMASALMDADRKDTAAFMDGNEYPEYMDDEALADLWSSRLAAVEEKLSGLPAVKEIDKARHEISDACAKAAVGRDPGLFLLHVDTGGGKTLSGLRFALAHAGKYGLRRLFFTAPRLAIIDQNAGDIRDYIQDDSIVLEHHSDVSALDGRGVSWRERVLLSEGWDSPVVITTAVQFLNALFSGDTSCIRRMHALCRACILIDEVQAVPDNQLTLFCMAVNFLTWVGRSSVVLCSATQPELTCIQHSLIWHGAGPIRKIDVPREKWAHVFRRSEIVWRPDIRTLDAIAAAAVDLMGKYGSNLVVCNTKKEARDLYGLVVEIVPANVHVSHLSAGMCQRHRKDALAEVRAVLEAGRRAICVSTQVIEAGVHISFGSAIRFLAGLDSIIQTVGRVNRSWERGEGNLGMTYVVSLVGESLRGLEDIKEQQRAALALLVEYERDPAKFKDRLDSDEAIAFYYGALYRENGHRHDYPLGKDGGTLYDLLSLNRTYRTDPVKDFEMGDGSIYGTEYIGQAFKTAGTAYQVFGSGTRDVIVDYGRGREILLDLNGLDAGRDIGKVKSLLREAKEYTVSLFDWQLKTLGDELIELPGGALGVFGHYDGKVGFVMNAVPQGAVVD